MCPIYASRHSDLLLLFVFLDSALDMQLDFCSEHVAYELSSVQIKPCWYKN